MAQKQFIIDGGFAASGESNLEGDLLITGNILPTIDSDGTTGFDLGSTTAKWRDLYLSEGSLYINNQKVIEDNSGTIVVRADEDQSLTIKTEGTGVLTLQSDATVNFAATLQMAAGKRITDAGGNAVTLGDKIDMDGNRVFNLGAPISDTDASTKKYVDDLIEDVIGGAPAALDTLNELANALGDDASYASSITTALADKASISYVDTAVANVTVDLTGYATESYVDTQVATVAVPTNVSAFTNDAGYLTSHQDLSTYALKTELFSGDYADLTGTPTIPTVPTNVSAFTNDSGYLTSHQSLANYATTAYVDNKVALLNTAIGERVKSLVHVHGSVVVVTSAQETSNTGAAVSIDLGETGLDSHQVFLNRQLLRANEATYNSANGQVTFSADLLAASDELEIVGVKASFS